VTVTLAPVLAAATTRLSGSPLFESGVVAALIAAAIWFATTAQAVSAAVTV
jgi:hypothetical protein